MVTLVDRELAGFDLLVPNEPARTLGEQRREQHHHCRSKELDPDGYQVRRRVVPLGAGIHNTGGQTVADDLYVLVHVDGETSGRCCRCLGKVNGHNVRAKTHGHRGYCLSNDKLSKPRVSKGAGDFKNNAGDGDETGDDERPSPAEILVHVDGEKTTNHYSRCQQDWAKLEGYERLTDTSRLDRATSRLLRSAQAAVVDALAAAVRPIKGIGALNSAPPTIVEALGVFD